MSLQRVVALPAAAFKLTAATGPPADSGEPDGPALPATASFAPTVSSELFVRILRRDEPTSDLSGPAARDRGSRVVLLPGAAHA